MGVVVSETILLNYTKEGFQWNLSLEYVKSLIV
jgi:hypothetical protein